MVKSSRHNVGIGLVLLGIVLAIVPLVFSAKGWEYGRQAFYCSMMYLSSGVPAAVCMLIYFLFFSGLDTTSRAFLF